MGEVATEAPLFPPDRVRMRVLTLPSRLRREACDGLAAEVELRVDDEPYTLALAGGTCVAREGPSVSPATRVTADAETWLAIDEGRLTGMDAFLARRLTVRGNLDLALRLQALFLPFGRQRAPHDLEQLEVRADGVRLSTYVFGREDGPAVLMLHGLGGAKVSLAPLFPALAPDHRLIVPDLPGHGESDKPRADYSARYYARVARHLLDALGVDRAVVLGNSLGGRIGLEMAVRSPMRVRGLVLLGPAVPGFRVQAVMGFARVVPTGLGRIPFPLRERWMQLALRRLFGDPSAIPPEGYLAAADEFIRIYRDPRARLAFFASLRQLLTEPPGPFWARMRKVRVPTLVVWGTRDHLVPPRLGPRLADALPQGRLEMLEGVGHVPQFEAPGEVLARIAPFLAGLGD